jgi:hypothetical protein
MAARKFPMTFLSDFSPEVVASHALVVADILAGLPPSPDTYRELAAEVLTVDKLAVMISRQVKTIQAAHDAWQCAFDCFQASLDLWSRLPTDADGLLAGHHRLLTRLLHNAAERIEFYHVTDADRQAFNAQRDHYFPAPLA